MRRIIFYPLLFFSLILEIGVLARFFNEFYLTLIATLIFLATLKFTQKEILVVAGVTGAIMDISTLSRSLFMTVFLLIEVLLINFIGKKFFNFNSNISLVLGSLFFTLLAVIGKLLISRSFEFSLNFVSVIIINFIVSLLLVFIWIGLEKRSYEKTN